MQSPSYASDGIAFYVYWTYPSPTPASASCTAWRTKDAGASWELVKSPTSYETCGGPVVGGSRGIVFLLVNTFVSPVGGRVFQQAYASDGSKLPSPSPQSPGYHPVSQVH